jgi:hypothetical protein
LGVPFILVEEMGIQDLNIVRTMGILFILERKEDVTICPTQGIRSM